MRFLFLDEEFASSKGTKSYICSFGYVLTDVSLNVMEKGDIFINPETKFDNYVVDNILNHDIQFYKKQKNFFEVYPKIKSLIDENTIIVGHEIRSDISALLTAIKRYNFEYPTFEFIDSKVLYTEIFKGDMKSPGLDRISLDLRCLRQDSYHESLDDASIVLEQVSIISKLLDKTFVELIKEYDSCMGKCENGESYMYEATENPKEISENSLFIRQNLIDYNLLLNTLVPKKKKKYSIKKFLFATGFELYNFKEMMVISNKLSECGGIITHDDDFDFYISHKGDESRRMNKALNKENIVIMDIETLKTEIEYSKEPFQKELDDAYSLIETDEEYETDSSFSLSDLFKNWE